MGAASFFFQSLNLLHFIFMVVARWYVQFDALNSDIYHYAYFILYCFCLLF